MTQRFEKAYNALYNAFMNNTLAKGSYRACAVGNIVADAMGGNVYKEKSGFEYGCNVINSWWSEMFITTHCGQSITTTRQNLDVTDYRKRIKNLTGYTWKELAKVERVFEQNTKINHQRYCEYSEKDIMEDQFNGLMAVMDVLIKFDNVEEGNKCKETFKNKFVKTNYEKANN
jgi:hypothetical protein